MIIPLDKGDLVINFKAMGPWCRLPYPDHPKGCPNYGKKETCPPFSKPFYALVKPPFYLVIYNFDLEAQVLRMKKRHPEWSERQCRNLLYWQKGVTKKLREEANSFIQTNEKDLILLKVPESNGVNLFLTCENIGIKLEKNPQKIVKKMMIIGHRKK